MIPAGKYRATAIQVQTEDGRTVFAQIGSSAEKKTPQVVITFRVSQGELAGEELTWYGYFSEATAPHTIKGLRACGFQGDDLNTIEEQQLDKEVQVVVEHESWTNPNTGEVKSRAKIRWVNALGGVTVAPLDETNRKRLAAEMRHLFKSTPVTAAPKANGSAPPPSQSKHVDDDINF